MSEAINEVPQDQDGVQPVLSRDGDGDVADAVPCPLCLTQTHAIDDCPRKWDISPEALSYWIGVDARAFPRPHFEPGPDWIHLDGGVINTTYWSVAIAHEALWLAAGIDSINVADAGRLGVYPWPGVYRQLPAIDGPRTGGRCVSVRQRNMADHARNAGPPLPSFARYPGRRGARVVATLGLVAVAGVIAILQAAVKR